MNYGLNEDEIEDLLNARLKGMVPREVITAIATAVGVNNARLATDIQRKIDSVLEELIH